MRPGMGEDDWTSSQRVGAAAFLNLLFTIIEFVGGFWTNSLAVLSDALHDLGDTIALLTAWIAERKAQQPPDLKRTFGYQRLSLFSAVFSAVLLAAGSLFIFYQAVPRLLNPAAVNARGMLLLAVLGLLFNGVAAYRLRRGDTLNEEVLSLHLLEDVAGWAVLLLGSTAIYFWDLPVLDPVMTVGFTLFILYRAGSKLWDTFNIFLQGVPAHIDIEMVEEELVSLEGVERVHDIHIWSLEGETDIFTGHVVVTPGLLEDPDATRRRLKDVLEDHHIEHSTIELETEQFCSGFECRDGYGT